MGISVKRDFELDVAKWGLVANKKHATVIFKTAKHNNVYSPLDPECTCKNAWLIELEETRIIPRIATFGYGLPTHGSIRINNDLLQHVYYIGGNLQVHSSATGETNLLDTVADYPFFAEWRLEYKNHQGEWETIYDHKQNSSET